MLLPERVPPARGNAVADDERAALLGFHVFFDARFSADNETRCATCHAPEASFSDARPTPNGVRNAPTIFNAAWSRWFFWDGRADSLWSQPLFAFEGEMHFPRAQIALRLQKSYAADYAAIFGPLSDDTDLVVANLGKALEAYMRKIATGRAAFDRFLLGDDAAMRAEAKRGYDVFLAKGCADCHSGPTLSDERFYRVVDGADPGRGAAHAILAASLFVDGGAFSDDDDLPPLDYEPGDDDGAFKTPSLRNVTLTAPYFHDGRFATLDEAIAAHGEALTAKEREDVGAFLNALVGAYPPPPWNNWPEK